LIFVIISPSIPFIVHINTDNSNYRNNLKIPQKKGHAKS
jgi:hypothetical protein